MDEKRGIPIELSTVLVSVILALVLFQGFGLVFGDGLGLDIKLGPLFVLLPLGIAALASVAIVKKMLSNYNIERGDIFAVVVIMMIALLAMFFLEDIVPQVFSVEMIRLQSMIGLGG